jgi:hypothetical protein
MFVDYALGIINALNELITIQNSKIIQLLLIINNIFVVLQFEIFN